MIRTGQLLAGLAKSVGYQVVGVDLFRTRLATATKEQLREEVLILRWPGPDKTNGWPQQSNWSAMVMKDEPSKTSMKAKPSSEPPKQTNRYSAIAALETGGLPYDPGSRPIKRFSRAIASLILSMLVA